MHAKLMLVFNLGQHLPGGVRRGFQIYLWKNRGGFTTMISRYYGPKRSIPEMPIFAEMELDTQSIAEVDYRFDALKPFLKPDAPRFDAAST